MELLLNRELYSRAGIEDAISAFAETARGTLTEDANYYRVTLDVQDADAELLRDEFANYALFATCERRHA